MTDVSRMLCVLLAVAVTSFSAKACESINTPPTVDFLIRKFGYPAETHNVTTTDGYILELSRIPGSKDDAAERTTNRSRPAILLMHGLGQNGASFLLRRNESLAFVFADKGFDVWLGSARGTSASKRHVSLSTESKEFWDFSWHESGLYDLPAMISHIKQTTGQERIQFVGHSMGTTMFFVMCSLLPERCEQDIRGAYLIAPVAYLGHVRGIINLLAHAVEAFGIRSVIKVLVDSLLHGEFPISSETLRELFVPIGSSRLTWRPFFWMVEVISGTSQIGTVSREAMADLVCYSADDISLRQLLHYVQIITKGNVFRQFNYGKQQNLKRYGSSSPPSYPLKNITIPLSLYIGSNDNFVQKQDIKLTLADLPNVQRLYQVPREQFSHFDFIIAEDAKSLVYDKIATDALQDVL